MKSTVRACKIMFTLGLGAALCLLAGGLVSACPASAQDAAPAQDAASAQDAAPAQATEPAEEAEPAQEPAQKTELVPEAKSAPEASESDIEPSAPVQVIVVVGAAGTDEYGEQFQQWAMRWRDVAQSAQADVTLIGMPDASSETTDRDALLKTLDSVTADASTALWIALIGHGTFYQETAKFNLRGPDVSAAELAERFGRIERPIVVVNQASASGPFINRLSGEGRVIVTATKSGSEQNFARFGDFFSSAIGAADADLDHDDQVSVLEAFLRASSEVAQFYEAEARLSTEHALLDDNGDSRGTPATMYRGTRAEGEAKDARPLDGLLARRLILAPAAASLPFTPEELRRRDQLEQQIDELRVRKASLSEPVYFGELEKLMLQLAQLYQAAEARAKTETAAAAAAGNN